MKIQGQGLVPLEENRFTVSVKQDKAYIYHYYRYPFEGSYAFGRWYNTQYPLSNLHALPPSNEFVYTMDNFELNESGSETGKATFRIKFKPKAAEKMRALGQT